jgi:hypothetical protein
MSTDQVHSMRDEECRSNIALLSKELILCQQRVSQAHSEINIGICITRKLLSESFELLKKLDAHSPKLER